MARLEALLLWAGNEDLTCEIDDPRPHLERAQDMTLELLARREALRIPDVPPEPQPEPTPEPEPEPVIFDVPNVVHFAFDVDRVEGLSGPVLDSIVAVLRDIPEVRIEVEGHADRRADDAYNQALGERRANNVAQFLIARGIARDRITVRSLGEGQAYISAPQDESDHALNRRVDIVFVGPNSERIRVHRQVRDVKRFGS